MVIDGGALYFLGGVAPSGSGLSGLSKPQHTTEPSVFTPQLCTNPALTEANGPLGGVD